MHIYTPHRLGPALTLATALTLIVAGAHVALTVPALSGAHLIAGPALIIIGAALIARLLHIAGRN